MDETFAEKLKAWKDKYPTQAGPSQASETTFFVVGVSFENRQSLLSPIEADHMKTGKRYPVELLPEPQNQYDPNAVAVLVEFNSQKVKIGYVPRECTQDVLGKCDKLKCKVLSIGRNDKDVIGVKVLIQEKL